MKQLVQSLNNEGTILIESDIPKVSEGKILIKSITSLISTGTEKMLVDFGSANYFDKAKQQPDKVKQVIQKIKTDGLGPTIETVKNKLDMPIPLGYCNVGEVCEVGPNVNGFSKGDLVVSNGGHSEYVLVPKNLCAKLPNNVSPDEAVFTVLASIALQGIRLANPTIGETFVVMGLGLVGQLTVELLIANGCRVIAYDLNKDRVDFANKSGAQAFQLYEDFDPVSHATSLSYGHGADGVLITANTSSNLVIKQAANMCRKRARIILVGVTGLNISRDDFYEKELTFQVSSSYGPGRYEKNYEEKGLDYPIGFVRWTEQRNFLSILELMSTKKISPSKFITNRYDIDNVAEKYGQILKSQDSLGILIDYANIQNPDSISKNKPIKQLNIDSNQCSPIYGLIGSGEYARRVLIPNLKKEKAMIKTVASQNGLSGYFSAKKNNILNSTTDWEKVINDNQINTIVISTRHNSHAKLIIEALDADKNVFVEKPLCINEDELNQIMESYKNLKDNNRNPKIMVGFNRRFSPLTYKLKKKIDSSSNPSSCIITVNAGRLDQNHWLTDPSIGGGRLIGEVCHFIDLLYFLMGGNVKEITTSQMSDTAKDSISMNFLFHNGSIGNINYLCNGNKNFAKERIEVFNDNNIYQINNFKNFRHFSNGPTKNTRLFFQDKGHRNCIKEFNQSLIKGSDMPISIDDIFEVSRIAIKASNECGLS